MITGRVLSSLRQDCDLIFLLNLNFKRAACFPVQGRISTLRAVCINLKGPIAIQFKAGLRQYDGSMLNVFLWAECYPV